MTYQVTKDAQQFFRQIDDYMSRADVERVQSAFSFARRGHGIQRRRSGELFFIHPLAVARYLADHQMDAPALMAALMHDVAEDTPATVDEIGEQFGKDVALLVDGVTKLKDVAIDIRQGRKMSRKEIQDGTFVKLLGVMTNDIRSVIVKLFDRLHNLRTISSMPPHKQVEKAEETLLVYAPLANRLGIWMLKSELEALSLQILEPEAYHTIKKRMSDIHQEQMGWFNQINAEIYSVLMDADIHVLNVELAPEGIYTVYQDLLKKETSFRHVDRTMRLVILLDNWPSCYQALGHLHRLWRPIPNEFDDYIAVPRENLYQSLHTTVVHSNGQRLKLRFRTPIMAQVAKIGSLARWKYAGLLSLWSSTQMRHLDAFIENVKTNIQFDDAALGAQGVIEDVFRRQIRVYTPAGKILELVMGATPIDFAYRIHTELGDHCSSAKVNGVLHPLNRPLQDGDMVKIFKTPTARPHRAWLEKDLGYIGTTYAYQHARRWFRKLLDETAVNQGRSLLKIELSTIGLPDYSPEEAAKLLGYPSIIALYYALGRADMLTEELAVNILLDDWEQASVYDDTFTVYSTDGIEYAIVNTQKRELHLCGSCLPTPPDVISGYVRANDTVTVHHATCHVFNRGKISGQTLRLQWAKTAVHKIRTITIRINVVDRYGLLHEITELLRDEQINISQINTYSLQEGNVRMLFSLAMDTPQRLVRILHQIRAMDNVALVHAIHKKENADGGDGSLSPYYQE